MTILNKTLLQVKNIPNALTLTRIIFSPLLLYFVYSRNDVGFVVFALMLFVTDFLDGFVARRYKFTSDIGRRLDGLADFVFYSFFAIGAVFLVWDSLEDQHLPLVFMSIFLVVLPEIIGILKYRRLDSVHTRGYQLLAYIVFIFISVTLLDTLHLWFFYLVVFFSFLAGLEKGVFYLLSTSSDDFKLNSLWQLLKKR